MNKSESKNQYLKELFNIVVFWFAVIGGITTLAFIFESYRGAEVISLGFFKQIIIYVTSLTVGIVICFTDIIPMKLSQSIRVTITILGLYVAMLIYFSKAPINPFKSIPLFAINTIWYIFMVSITWGVWYVYKRITSNNYNKYLINYQKKLNH